MAATEGKAPRTFRVQKDSGDFWDMTYAKTGVTWKRAEGSFDEPADVAGHPPPLGGRIGPIEAITSIADTAANIGVWWEIRQQRLLNEAMNEETRRISWLADMIARWGEVHRQGDRLDFRVSEYLAREATETMNSIVANKRIALPQSMLYELETVQDTFRSFRSLMLAQFETLAGDSRMDLDGAVRRALPRSRLNMDFIRALGEDPSTEWVKRVREKTTGEFEREITDAMRDPSVFLSRVFPSTEPAIPEPQEVEKNPGFAERLINLLAPALPLLLAVESKTDASERRDAFRELSLLSAEVSRVIALNSAWLATNAIVAVSSGKELQVQVSALGLGVGLASPHTGRELGPTSPREE
ncbi:hypothetical protein [Diaminobutyricimonas sp. LJ205]|uniref:hypothetical protein n=1 Tax=Diaminobutyricimonas sp. LJ205 TaxID=2683590 RepID=UPI0018E04033|nr:hypothetical protein [Diaminobutyricimonas sp. LJ205]